MEKEEEVKEEAWRNGSGGEGGMEEWRWRRWLAHGTLQRINRESAYIRLIY